MSISVTSFVVHRHGPDPRASSAAFSSDGIYRYTLNRRWDVDPETEENVGATLGWIMLNPSTADAFVDDPTIRRCVSFAKMWGYGGITVVNLFAVRSTDPAVLRSHVDPVGPDNDTALRLLVQSDDVRTFMAAWGSHPVVEQRAARVVSMLRTAGAKVECLGLTKTGHPRHPLYVRGDTAPMPYGGAL